MTNKLDRFKKLRDELPNLGEWVDEPKFEITPEDEERRVEILRLLRDLEESPDVQKFLKKQEEESKIRVRAFVGKFSKAAHRCATGLHPTSLTSTAFHSCLSKELKKHRKK